MCASRLQSKTYKYNHSLFYGLFAEEIYMELPYDYEEEDYVCCLNKALYGLKQAPHMWYETLQLFLEGLGFQAVQSDSAVFVSKNIIITVYIDDLLLCRLSSNTLNQFKKHLQQFFKMMNLRQVSHYLSMKVDVSEGSELIIIRQSTYIQNMLEHFNMQDCTPLSTLMDSSMFGSLITNTEKATPEEILWYQQAVESLMWLMCQIRLDITFAVGVVACYTLNSSQLYKSAVLCIFWYLYGSIDIGITYRMKGNRHLINYSDTDYAADKMSRWFITEYVFKLAGVLITYSLMLQKSMALFTCKAEYMTLTEADCKAVHLHEPLQSLQYAGASKVSLIYDDNRGSINLTANPKHYKHTKYIDVCHHWIREVVNNQHI